MRFSLIAAASAVLLATMVSVACSDDGDGEGSITLYSGRNEALVQPIIDRFSEETGIKVVVRYGDTTELAGVLLEEGKNSPADVYFAQDAGALGAVSDAGLLSDLPQAVLDLVPAGFRADNRQWVGLSGRSRVVVYNTDALTEADLPDNIAAFTDPAWRGRIGWVPTNASFQSFVTAFRLLEGEDAARAWLDGIQANNPKVYENNAGAVEGVANGEVDVAFVNHYYLFRFLAEQGEGFKARNHFLSGGDVGALVNVAGAGILGSSGNKEDAQALIKYLLSTAGQEYFANETYEYPLVAGVAVDERLPALEDLQPPELDLSNLDDLEGTVKLLQETGLLP
jgi:iron(III) transport system substrate-binding protein